MGGLAPDPQWRRLLDRGDSPWYPSMRLFRQPMRGDWAAVFREMQQAVCRRLGAAPLPAAAPRTAEPPQPPAAGKTGDPRVATTTISEAVATAIEHCEAKRFEAAEEIFRWILEVEPGNAAVHNNLGNALQEQGKLEEAVVCYRRALELQPDFAMPYNNLGGALHWLGELDEAVRCYEQALKLNPDFIDAHNNLAITHLLRGDFSRGWPEYEWRWGTKQFTPRNFPQPLWDGSPLTGKTILLHAEQGLGDTFQFIRYAPLVKRLGGTVIVECQNALRPLIARCPGIDQLVGQGDAFPPSIPMHRCSPCPRFCARRWITSPPRCPISRRRRRWWIPRARSCAACRATESASTGKDGPDAVTGVSATFRCWSSRLWPRSRACG